MPSGAAYNNHLGDVDQDILGNQEATQSDSGQGGWDEQYLEDIFGAVEDIQDDDELALEHLGEAEFRRQMSEQEEMKRARANSLEFF